MKSYLAALDTQVSVQIEEPTELLINLTAYVQNVQESSEICSIRVSRDDSASAHPATIL